MDRGLAGKHSVRRAPRRGGNQLALKPIVQGTSASKASAVLAFGNSTASASLSGSLF